MSTAYHPQTNGQTERVNQELEQYLRIFVRERQDDWYTLLPLAEFSYNNHIHSPMRQTPFILDTGQHPQMGFEPHQPPSCFEAVNEFTDRMKDTLKEAKAVLAKAKDDTPRPLPGRKTCRKYLGILGKSQPCPRKGNGVPHQEPGSPTPYPRSSLRLNPFPPDFTLLRIESMLV